MADVTFLPEPQFPARGRLALFAVDPATDLSAAAARLRLPAGAPATARLALPQAGRLVACDVAVRVIALDAALPALLTPPGEDTPAWLHPAEQQPASLTCWQLAARLGVTLVTGHRLVPRLVRAGDRVHGVWHALPDDDSDEAAALARLAAALPVAAHAVVRDDDGLWPPAALLAAFLDAVADTAARAGRDARRGRPRARLLPWTARWAEALTDPVDPHVPLRDDADELVAATTAWVSSAHADDEAGTAELTLHAPDEAAGRWRLRFAVRAPDGTLVEAADVWRDGATLQDALLRGLGRCARVFPPLDAALSEPAPEHVDLDLDDAWLLLRDAVPLLELAGVRVRMPFELVEGTLHARLRLGVAPPDVPAAASASDEEEEPSAAVGDGRLQGLLTGFRWEIALGEETLTSAEFDELVAAQAPLVRWRERWVRVDPAEAARLRDLGGGGQLPLAQALAIALEGRAPTPAGDAEADVAADGSVADLVERVRAAGDRPPVGVSPPGFHGELRPYQQRGVAWLQGMGELGLGAVLADDMGLGKTVQLAAYLLTRQREPNGGVRPALVVCPTSVVGNWERELARFAPALPVLRHHGTARPTTLQPVDGVVVTSYGTLRRDVELLATVAWDVVALDEAQQVKNPQTAAARAVRRLRADHVVALTGTPLENRLAELWSLLDATNPGLLGSRTAFGRRFVAPIEQRRDADAAVRLRRLVAPFVLRREKRDPAVIADLPPKIERTVVCPLTPEQAALYQAAVERALDQAAAQRGMQRRGRILALLTALKQICNHPAQYLKEAEEPDLLGRSGKLAVARELVAEAVGAGEQVLVFTQYVAMGHLLARQLHADLGLEVPFLHGGSGAAARDGMVARFQHEDPDTPAPPVMVLSLRAGGTGLNLSAATHVVHYDRWWNPAVEDQATDRAHRIGQTRTVEVHKLVTAGTVEERVAELLERKRALADTVVGAGETWITELDDRALAELVALAADAPITELDEDEEAA